MPSYDESRPEEFTPVLMIWLESGTRPISDPLTSFRGGCNVSRMIQREVAGMFDLAVDALEAGATRPQRRIRKGAR